MNDSFNHLSKDCLHKRLPSRQLSTVRHIWSLAIPSCLLLLSQPTKLLCSIVILITPSIRTPQFQNLKVMPYWTMEQVKMFVAPCSCQAILTSGLMLTSRLLHTVTVPMHFGLEMVTKFSPLPRLVFQPISVPKELLLYLIFLISIFLCCSPEFP